MNYIFLTSYHFLRPMGIKENRKNITLTRKMETKISFIIIV